MYLEERIEQVERQNAKTARAVADLTVDVRTIRHDQTEGFKQTNARFDRVEQRLDMVEQRIDKIEQRLDRVEQRLDMVEQRLDKIEQDVGTIKQTLQLVLTYLHEKLP